MTIETLQMPTKKPDSRCEAQKAIVTLGGDSKLRNPRTEGLAARDGIGAECGKSGDWFADRKKLSQRKG
jgi:hypothetical protein